MYRLQKRPLILIALFLLAGGCTVTVGRKFQPLDYNTIALGRTTRQDIIGVEGEPYKQGTTTVNGVTMHTDTYVYGEGKANPYSEVKPAAKALTISYYEDRIVRYYGVSQFESDTKSLDTSVIAQIEKGKTTRSNLLELFGPPVSEAVYPASAKGTRTMSWQFSSIGGTISLAVDLNDRDVVASVATSEVGR